MESTIYRLFQYVGASSVTIEGELSVTPDANHTMYFDTVLNTPLQTILLPGAYFEWYDKAAIDYGNGEYHKVAYQGICDADFLSADAFWTNSDSRNYSIDCPLGFGDSAFVPGTSVMDIAHIQDVRIEYVQGVKNGVPIGTPTYVGQSLNHLMFASASGSSLSAILSPVVHRGRFSATGLPLAPGDTLGFNAWLAIDHGTNDHAAKYVGNGLAISTTQIQVSSFLGFRTTNQSLYGTTTEGNSPDGEWYHYGGRIGADRWFRSVRPPTGTLSWTSTTGSAFAVSGTLSGGSRSFTFDDWDRTLNGTQFVWTKPGEVIEFRLQLGTEIPVLSVAIVGGNDLAAYSPVNDAVYPTRGHKLTTSAYVPTEYTQGVYQPGQDQTYIMQLLRSPYYGDPWNPPLTFAYVD